MTVELLHTHTQAQDRHYVELARSRHAYLSGPLLGAVIAVTANRLAPVEFADDGVDTSAATGRLVSKQQLVAHRVDHAQQKRVACPPKIDLDGLLRQGAIPVPFPA